MSPQIHLANCMSFGITVTLLAWITHKLACSSSPMRNASPASCKAFTAIPWNLKSALLSCMISLTNLWNGNLLISSSVLFWHCWISFNALIPLSIFFTSSFFSASPSFPFFLLISLTLLALAIFSLSLSTRVRVLFTLHAMSSNKDRFYFTTAIPILRLLITNWSTQ